MALYEAYRLRDAFARAAIEEYAPAARIAHSLHDCYSPVSARLRGDISGNVVRVVRYAQLPYYSRRVRDFGGKNDRLREMVFAAVRPTFQRLRRIHSRSPHSTGAVGFEPLKRVGVDKHRAAQRIRAFEHRHYLVRPVDSFCGEKFHRLAPSLLRVGRFNSCYLQSLQPYHGTRLFDLEVDEIGRAFRVMQRTRRKVGERLRNIPLAHYALRARYVRAIARRAHFHA